MTFQFFRRKLKNFTFQRAYQKLRYRIWSAGTILLLSRPAGALPDEVRINQCGGTFAPVTEENVQDCAAFEDPARYVPAYRDMLRQGDFVLFGYLEGACVFRSCLQLSGSILYWGRTAWELAANEAYVHYVFCAPAARRKGFHEAALRYMCAAFPDRDFYAQVREDNIPSLRGFYRTGFRPAVRLTAKNRFFHSTLTETPLTEEEIETLLSLVRPRTGSGNIDNPPHI